MGFMRRPAFIASFMSRADAVTADGDILYHASLVAATQQALMLR